MAAAERPRRPTKGRKSGVVWTNWLAGLLRAPIESGEWPPGRQLPTQKRLMDDHDLSSTTVRNAVKLLQREGLVLTYHGKGTFVAAAEPTHRLDVTWHEPGRSGRPSVSYVPAPHTHPERRCTQRLATVSKHLATQFELEVDTDVVEREIRILVSGWPIVISTSYVPPELAGDADGWEDTAVGDLALPGRATVSRWFEERGRVATPDEIKHLRLPVGAHLAIAARPCDVRVGDRTVPAGVIVVARCDEVLVRHSI